EPRRGSRCWGGGWLRPCHCHGRHGKAGKREQNRCEYDLWIVHGCFPFNCCWCLNLRGASSFESRTMCFCPVKRKPPFKPVLICSFLNALRLSEQSVVQFLDVCTEKGTALRAVPAIHFAAFQQNASCLGGVGSGLTAEVGFVTCAHGRPAPQLHRYQRDH